MIWLIGAGEMSVNYLKVLEAKNEKFIVIGRGEVSATKYQKETGKTVVMGGLKIFLTTNPEIPASAIVSVGVDQLYNTTQMLLDYGVKHILVEKPGGMFAKEIESLEEHCGTLKANIYIAYNRRFFSSVRKAQEMICLDGGVTSFNFELTEWGHVIEKLNKTPEVLAKWFLANTTHVADLAFFLGGKPEQVSSYTRGSLSWHPTSSVFAGAGVSDKGALFNYCANWESAGRWSVEILTNKNKYVLRPMEQLQVQPRGAVRVDIIEINDTFDVDFKPGLYMQVDAFLKHDTSNLCSIGEQRILFSIYEKMAGYQ